MRNKEILTNPSLEQVLSYKNDMIVYKFLESFDLSFAEASDIFENTKKWLWLAGCEAKNKPNLTIYNEMVILDEMWHTFILFTPDYFSFCFKYFGKYIHHAPTTKLEKDNFREEVRQSRKSVMQEKENSLRVLYNFIYDNLGGETLRLWFEIYPEKYPASKIYNIKKLD